MTNAATVVARPVRLPFRILGGIFCLAAAFACGGAVLMAWRGVRPVTVADVAVIPGMLWLFRLVFHAVWSGTVPTQYPHWPFATAWVMRTYVLPFVVFDIFGR